MNILIKEVLRLYNPAFGLLPRISKQNHKVGDIEVTKGSLLISGFLANTDPKYFENPDKFDPERWNN